MADMITFEQTISAAPERVFDAFIAPDDLAQWHRAGNRKMHVFWSFEPDNTFPRDFQRDGWASRLANLERYLTHG